MKKYFTLVFMCLAMYQGFSAEWTNLRSDVPQPGQKGPDLLQIRPEFVIHFPLDGFLRSDVNTPTGPAVVISLEDATRILQKGAPDLPKMTASVIIPDLAAMQIEVLEAVYQDFANILVAPSKGNLTRDIDPSTVPYEFGIEYTTNAFFPGELADLREPYIVRDYRGQTIVVYPFRYNPVTKTLRVYTDITVKISRVNDQGVNQLIRTRAS